MYNWNKHWGALKEKTAYYLLVFSAELSYSNCTINSKVLKDIYKSAKIIYTEFKFSENYSVKLLIVVMDIYVVDMQNEP